MFQVVPIFRYGPVFSDDDESLSELDEIDFLQAVSDAVVDGTLAEADARAMVNREDELNAIRRA